MKKTANVRKSKSTKKNRKLSVDMLKKINFVAAGLHLVQAVAIVALANRVTGLRPISVNFLANDNLSGNTTNQVLIPALRHLFDLNLAYVVAAFFAVSAIAHLLSATIYKKRYEADLKNSVNKLRWIELAFSGSFMVIAVAILAGVYDIASLLAIFGLYAVMNLIGIIVESSSANSKKPSWFNLLVSAKAGFVPWVMFGIYAWGAQVYGVGLPTFVYWIFASMFILMALFGLIMYFAIKKSNKWADYLYVEQAYIVLGIVTKAVLAWQIFAGTLR